MIKKLFSLAIALSLFALTFGLQSGDAQAATTLNRLSGANRIETAIAISNDSHGDSSASALVIATSKNWPDGLTAGPLASAVGGPLLLNPTDFLSSEVAAEIIRVLDLTADATPDVYVVGGSNAISATTVAAIDALHPNIDTKVINGPTRYETAVAVAEEIDTLVGFPAYAAMLANGDNFPDALALSAPAADQSIIATSGSVSAQGIPSVLSPILLTKSSSLHPATAAHMTAASAGIGGLTVVHIGGGIAAVSDAVKTAVDAIVPTVKRHAGADRYLTAQAIAEYFYPAPFKAGFASGENFPDAEAGGVHSAFNGQPILLVTSSNVPPATADYIGTHKTTLTGGNLYGGTATIPGSIKSSLEALF